MKSPIAWPGGKRNLLQTLLRRIPEHSIYVEVFAGSAKLLFAKPPARSEVLNDMNGDLINFFRVVKHRPAELAELFDRELRHADRFRELRAAKPVDELERALRFAYLTWYSYGAKGEHFAGAQMSQMTAGTHGKPLKAIRQLLEQTAERLKDVLVERRDFAEMLKRYDSAETFFYLDPPYVDYQANGRYDALTPERREELFTLCAGMRGTFLLSFDDHPEVRQLCGRHGLSCEEVRTTYTLGNRAASREKRKELLISRPLELAAAGDVLSTRLRELPRLRDAA